jgi:hypothetical protein
MATPHVFQLTAALDRHQAGTRIGTMTAVVARQEGWEPQPCVAGDPHPAAGLVLALPAFATDVGTDPWRLALAWTSQMCPTPLDEAALDALMRRLQRARQAIYAPANHQGVPRTMGAVIWQAMQALDVGALVAPYVGALRGWRSARSEEAVLAVVHAQIEALQTRWAQRARAAVA